MVVLNQVLPAGDAYSFCCAWRPSLHQQTDLLPTCVGAGALWWVMSMSQSLLSAAVKERICFFPALQPVAGLALLWGSLGGVAFCPGWGSGDLQEQRSEVGGFGWWWCRRHASRGSFCIRLYLH